MLCNAIGRCPSPPSPSRISPPSPSRISPPSPSPVSNSTRHSANVPAIVGGVVGGLFVAAAFTLVLIYVFCYKRLTTSAVGGGSSLCPTPSAGGGSGLWVYSS